MFGEWKLPRVQETFSCKMTFFKIDPSARKLQESGNKQKKNQRILTAFITSPMKKNETLVPDNLFFHVYDMTL